MCWMWTRPPTKPLPGNLDPAARELFAVCTSSKDRVLLVLDTEKAVEVGGNYGSRNEPVDASYKEGKAGQGDTVSRSKPEGV